MSSDLLSMTDPQTPTMLSLLAFRESLKRALGLTRLPMVQTDNSKHVSKTDRDVGYPYGKFTVQDFFVVRDSQAVKTVARRSRGYSNMNMADADVFKGYLFPTRSSVEVRIKCPDFITALACAEKFQILLASGKLNTTVSTKGFEWTVAIDDQQSPMSLPQATLEDESNPGRHEITVNLQITYVSGVIKSVPKINNEGRVESDLDVELQNVQGR